MWFVIVRYTEEEIESKIGKLRVELKKKQEEAAKVKEKHYEVDHAGRPL